MEKDPLYAGSAPAEGDLVAQLEDWWSCSSDRSYTGCQSTVFRCPMGKKQQALFYLQNPPKFNVPIDDSQEDRSLADEDDLALLSEDKSRNKKKKDKTKNAFQKGKRGRSPIRKKSGARNATVPPKGKSTGSTKSRTPSASVRGTIPDNSSDEKQLTVKSDSFSGVPGAVTKVKNVTKFSRSTQGSNKPAGKKQKRPHSPRTNIPTAPLGANMAVKVTAKGKGNKGVTAMNKSKKKSKNKNSGKSKNMIEGETPDDDFADGDEYNQNLMPFQTFGGSRRGIWAESDETFIQKFPVQLPSPESVLLSSSPAIPIKVRLFKRTPPSKPVTKMVQMYDFPVIEDDSVMFKLYQVQKEKDQENRKLVAYDWKISPEEKKHDPAKHETQISHLVSLKTYDKTLPNDMAVYNQEGQMSENYEDYSKGGYGCGCKLGFGDARPISDGSTVADESLLACAEENNNVEQYGRMQKFNQKFLEYTAGIKNRIKNKVDGIKNKVDEINIKVADYKEGVNEKLNEYTGNFRDEINRQRDEMAGKVTEYQDRINQNISECQNSFGNFINCGGDGNMWCSGQNAENAPMLEGQQQQQEEWQQQQQQESWQQQQESWQQQQESWQPQQQQEPWQQQQEPWKQQQTGEACQQQQMETGNSDCHIGEILEGYADCSQSLSCCKPDRKASFVVDQNQGPVSKIPTIVFDHVDPPVEEVFAGEIKEQEADKSVGFLENILAGLNLFQRKDKNESADDDINKNGDNVENSGNANNGAESKTIVSERSTNNAGVTQQDQSVEPDGTQEYPGLTEMKPPVKTTHKSRGHVPIKFRIIKRSTKVAPVQKHHLDSFSSPALAAYESTYSDLSVPSVAPYLESVKSLESIKSLRSLEPARQLLFRFNVLQVQARSDNEKRRIVAFEPTKRNKMPSSSMDFSPSQSIVSKADIINQRLNSSISSGYVTFDSQNFPFPEGLKYRQQMPAVPLSLSAKPIFSSVRSNLEDGTVNNSPCNLNTNIPSMPAVSDAAQPPAQLALERICSRKLEAEDPARSGKQVFSSVRSNLEDFTINKSPNNLSINITPMPIVSYAAQAAAQRALERICSRKLEAAGIYSSPDHDGKIETVDEEVQNGNATAPEARVTSDIHVNATKNAEKFNSEEIEYEEKTETEEVNCEQLHVFEKSKAEKIEYEEESDDDEEGMTDSSQPIGISSLFFMECCPGESMTTASMTMDDNETDYQSRLTSRSHLSNTTSYASSREVTGTFYTATKSSTSTESQIHFQGSNCFGCDFSQVEFPKIEFPNIQLKCSASSPVSWYRRNDVNKKKNTREVIPDNPSLRPMYSVLSPHIVQENNNGSLIFSTPANCEISRLVSNPHEIFDAASRLDEMHSKESFISPQPFGRPRTNEAVLDGGCFTCTVGGNCNDGSQTGSSSEADRQHEKANTGKITYLSHEYDTALIPKSEPENQQCRSVGVEYHYTETSRSSSQTNQDISRVITNSSAIEKTSEINKIQTPSIPIIEQNHYQLPPRPFFSDIIRSNNASPFGIPLLVSPVNGDGTVPQLIPVPIVYSHQPISHFSETANKIMTKQKEPVNGCVNAGLWCSCNPKCLSAWPRA